MPLLVGTSGWQYKHWKGRFYPENLKASEWLFHYSSCFRTVEVNNTFYRLPEDAAFQRWASSTPPDFTFAVKASRYLTHTKRLKDCAEPVSRLMERAGELGGKLGPVLLQLPPTFSADRDSLDATLRSFPRGQRVAVEFRHPSWQTDEVRGTLEKRGAALCLADRGSRPVGPLWRTADWSYLRLHLGAGSPMPCYGRTALESWVKRLSRSWEPGEDVYVFFNNDAGGCAVRDAVVFAASARRIGLEPSLTPTLKQAPVG